MGIEENGFGREAEGVQGRDVAIHSAGSLAAAMDRIVSERSIGGGANPWAEAIVP